MLLLILFAVFLLPIAAFAQTVPPPGLQGSVTVLHPVPGIDYAYDQHSNSATIYQTPLPGLSWYSQQNRFGNITQQGYLFEPFQPSRQLEVPSFSPSRERLPNAPVDSLLDR